MSTITVTGGAGISLAQSLLGYQPVIDFEEGMKRAIDYYRETASV